MNKCKLFDVFILILTVLVISFHISIVCKINNNARGGYHHVERK